jgi:proline dehydrogenase
MEGSAYTERTVALYERLRARHANVGICLQAYLRRSAADVARLLPLDPSIRLVKGAYDEPAALAYRTRGAVSTNYAALSIELLVAIAAGRPVRLGLGTHDVALIELLAAHAAALSLGRQAFEVQMLYGIRMTEQRRLAAEGYRVSDLIAYGTVVSVVHAPAGRAPSQRALRAAPDRGLTRIRPVGRRVRNVWPL